MSLVSRFGQDQRGNIAMMFGLSILPVVIAMGLALDYTRASDLKTRLQAAADYAALATMNKDNQGKSLAELENDAEALFQSSLDPRDAARLRNVKARVTTTDEDKKSLLLTFDGDIENALMPVAGIDTTTVTGSVSVNMGAARQPLRYHFLIDTSDSMGLAADDFSRDALRAVTPSETHPQGCEFACHLKMSSEPATYLEVARGIQGMKLRIDVAKSGIERALDMAEARESGQTAPFSFSLYSISDDLKTIIAPTTDKRAVRDALSQVDIGYKSPAEAATFFDKTLPNAAWQFRNHETSDVIILVTDGVQSARGKKNEDGTNDVRMIDLTYCDDLKKGGRKLAVIYTEYRPIQGDATYDATVANFRDQIEDRLRQCASSPDLFEMGDAPEDIVKAFETLFKKTYDVLRLAT
ncbi:membrane protein [Agaricicola taiwanensis]|uniref:Membrane protein n=1 Tax=Agaricicola taiwanensis TaxID=591372 RepID=A0A8J2VUG6_9RHOB|nr:pilus assembly protein TadG-related protein [Agaricicola taiwanensis]GGE40845.1 membrane protein [Agaricicola taiwanensis]